MSLPPPSSPTRPVEKVYFEIFNGQDYRGTVVFVLNYHDQDASTSIACNTFRDMAAAQYTSGAHSSTDESYLMAPITRIYRGVGIKGGFAARPPADEAAAAAMASVAAATAAIEPGIMASFNMPAVSMMSHAIQQEQIHLQPHQQARPVMSTLSAHTSASSSAATILGHFSSNTTLPSFGYSSSQSLTAPLLESMASTPLSMYDFSFDPAIDSLPSQQHSDDVPGSSRPVSRHSGGSLSWNSNESINSGTKRYSNGSSGSSAYFSPVNQSACGSPRLALHSGAVTNRSNRSSSSSSSGSYILKDCLSAHSSPPTTSTPPSAASTTFPVSKISALEARSSTAGTLAAASASLSAAVVGSPGALTAPAPSTRLIPKHRQPPPQLATAHSDSSQTLTRLSPDMAAQAPGIVMSPPRKYNGWAARRAGDATHDRRGLLTWTHNGDEFLVTLRPMPLLDGRYTVIGEVVAGMDVLESLEREALNVDKSPVRDIGIGECGLWVATVRV